MKRIISVIICILLPLTVFAGCSTKNTENGKIKIVTTVFPAYDFAKAVCGDLADITLLLPPGSESHSFEPTPADMVKAEQCDIFIYNGGESDKWVQSLIDSSKNDRRKVIKMLECVTLLTEEYVEGMHTEDAHGDDHTHTEDFDEHVWTSPVNAVSIAQKIVESAAVADEKNAQIYMANFDDYKKKLDSLDNRFKAIVENAKRKTVIFADRFPVRYFTEQYGLDYFAAFPGCASQTDTNAATIIFLIDKVKSENIPAVFYIEMSNGKTADTICESTSATKLLFHSCHNISKDDMENGETYLSLMNKNADNLEIALN